MGPLQYRPVSHNSRMKLQLNPNIEADQVKVGGDVYGRDEVFDGTKKDLDVEYKPGVPLFVKASEKDDDD